MSRVCLIGLDGLAPDLVFGKFKEQLTHLGGMARQGYSATLKSCIPPITVPAWPCMMSGVDPGMLGVYGFHDRVDRNYFHEQVPSSHNYVFPPLWRILSDHGLRCRVLSVPMSYPPEPILGTLVSCFLTPADAASNPMRSPTYPPSAWKNVQAETDGYMFDVEDFRTRPTQQVVDDIYSMTRKRFTLAKHWLRQDDWDFFAMVEMGPDRIQHLFWHYPDIVGAYYQFVDNLVGELLAELHADDAVMVVSDHGAKATSGGFALNEWLVAAGYLVLDHAPLPGASSLAANCVNWSKTRAWASGGYVGRIHFNVRDREPYGCVAFAELDTLARDMTDALKSISASQGNPWDTRVFAPRDIYRSCYGIAPDLLVYLDNLVVRAMGSLGHPTFFVENNDTGPDHANHAEEGVIMLRTGCRQKPEVPPTLYDIAPTVLQQFDIPVPSYMLGQALVPNG